jgi:Replication-relaxation
MIGMGATLAAALMRLTPRDRVLMQVLHELRYLTVHQIQVLCYCSVSVRATSHRLTLLRRRGLLDCLLHLGFEDRRAFWCLSPLGRIVAGALADAAPDRPRACAVAALQMDHLIAINQVFCGLCLEHRAGRLGAFRWIGSHHAVVDLGETRVVPDAVILSGTPEGRWWMYCLELDRHTMAADALCEKFARYRLMRRLASLRRDDPLWEARAASCVLFACQDARRAEHASRLAAESGLDGVWAGIAAELPRGLAVSLGAGFPVTRIASLPGLPGGITPPADARLNVGGGGEGAR